MDAVSFNDLSKTAYDYLNKQQEICHAVYKMEMYQNWFYDQVTGKLIFHDNGLKKLVVDYEVVGSVSEMTNTFLWAWANPNLEEKVRSKMIKVREYGEKRGFKKLIDSMWTADQYDGWEMTAISAYLLEAKGAYRIPVDDGKLFMYMIFKNIRWRGKMHTN